ncbi:hypothetical protein F5Y18DRAFT_193707 [Xylariaceae sp. FL1019]|nr:hypothetical protein F5Y18DRAFT_193707 [Xylariaceae sp. FL1019]
MTYFHLLSACPTVHCEDWIEQWIDGVRPPWGNRHLDTQTRRAEPPRKRRRLAPLDPGCDTLNRLSSHPSQHYPYLPNTPSAIGTTNQQKSMRRGSSTASRGRKRPVSDHDAGGRRADEVSLDGTTDLRPIAIPRRPPPTKTRSTSPIKARADLYRLAKPVYIQELEEEAIMSLPREMHSLYFDIRDAVEFQTRIVPLELRGSTSLLDDYRSLPEHSYSQEPSTKDAAEAILATVRRIKHQAALSARWQRHELAWNNLVHTPLLEFVFGPDNPLPPEQNASVRLEPVMSALIARDSVPRLDPRLFATSSNSGSALAWTVPESGPEQSVTDDSTISGRSESKKVDYVLVLDLAETAPLRKTISDLVLQISVRDGTSVHVNQTDYAPICNSPIAVSIETKSKSAARDPLLQLGIWIASWNKRMVDLRSWMLVSRGLVKDISEIEHPKLVSVPLILATGHDWEIYFACDQGHSIVIRGPVPLGSTSTTLKMFALLASLKLVKAWVFDAFERGLTAWFSPPESAYSSQGDSVSG